MDIRTYQPGDEIAQFEIYNQVGATLPKFKPVSLGEVQRRIRGRDFDPTLRYYAEVQGKVVGYATFQMNGRVSFPWTHPAHEAVREPLFQALLEGIQKRGLQRVFTAYREDWPTIHQFFLEHGFQKVRDMVNYIIDLVDMPTPAARPSTSFAELKPEDVPTVLDLAPQVLRIHDVGELHRYFFQNPLLPPENFFVLRSRTDRSVIALALLITDSNYADPKMVDAAMPCFRLGAFGTEGLTTKRIKGLFSFLARPGPNLNALGMDLMGQASYRLRDTDDIESLAGQVPSDAPDLLNFYNRNFRRQGSFPVFAREM